jgi:hypothetical protein
MFMCIQLLLALLVATAKVTTARNPFSAKNSFKNSFKNKNHTLHSALNEDSVLRSPLVVPAAARHLQENSNDIDNDIDISEEDEQVCDDLLTDAFDASFRPYCFCDRVDDTYVLDCISTYCPDCEILTSANDTTEAETCALREQGVVLVISEEDDESLIPNVFFVCTLYVSGSLEDTAVCLVEDDYGNCAVTVNDEQCNSCDYVECDSDSDNGDFYIDLQH